MTNTGVLLAGSDTDISEEVAEIARLSLPGAFVTTVKDLPEALGRAPASGPEVLVLAHPDAAELGRAVDAADSGGLPRWAVVVLDSNPSAGEAETLAPEEWNERQVARAFRSALAQHAMRRELVRARGDLLAIASRVTHDLRTQMAGILANAELLKEILVEAEPARNAIIQPIFDSIDNLEKIVLRLSFLTKASAHGAAKKPMDMGESVFRALQRMEGEISKKNASIVQPAFWPEVAGEAPWIETIWCNLVGNALKYGGERPRIELGWMRDEAEHKFWIRDSGAGVPPEKRSQLFQPFHLLHRTNSPKGLGLPLAQRLVELQGGRCGYAQWEEGGSDFFFTLPMGEESLRVVADRVAK